MSMSLLEATAFDGEFGLGGGPVLAAAAFDGGFAAAAVAAPAAVAPVAAAAVSSARRGGGSYFAGPMNTWAVSSESIMADVMAALDRKAAAAPKKKNPWKTAKRIVHAAALLSEWFEEEDP